MNNALTLVPALASDDVKPAVARTHEAANEAVAPLGAPVGALSQSWPSNPRRRGMLLAIGALHLLAGWLLMKTMVLPTPSAKHEDAKVVLIAPPPPPIVKPPQAPPVALPLVAPMPLITPPIVNIANPVVVAVAENNPPKIEPVAAAPALVPAPAAGPRQIPASAVHYIVEPQLHVPKMSRRLGESGTVILHVAVDTRGQIRSTSIRKSSGFERLDQQALQDIHGARFSPYLENGQPIEWEFDATFQYEVR